MTAKGKHPFHTILCDILGIQYPIIQGAIMHAGGPELVAAVSNAGGLGVLSSAGLSSEQLKHNITKTKMRTRKPFAVNIQAAIADFATSRAELAIAEGVEVVTLGRIDPKIHVTRLLKKHSVKVMAVIGNTKTAKLCEAQGIDIIIASGNEAGGHVGRVATFPLVPAVVDSVKIPVVAAGGIADARGFLAALSLGACGIQMGTRFYVTREANATNSELDKIIDASEDDTIVSTALTGAACRLIREDVLIKWEEKRKSGVSLQQLKLLSSEIQKKYWKMADDSVVSAGQSIGIITSVLTTKEVIDGIIGQASAMCQRLNKIANQ